MPCLPAFCDADAARQTIYSLIKLVLLTDQWLSLLPFSAASAPSIREATVSIFVGSVSDAVPHSSPRHQT